VKSSEATNEISAALAKAQGQINNPGKGSQNPHFRSKYADLSAGINAIREGLSANGIAFLQSPRMEGDVMMLDTRLTCGAQWFESEWPVCKLPAPPQQIGSALTYARRYSLFAMVGIAGEDDDANAANVAETPAPQPTLVNEDQVSALDSLLLVLGDDTRAKFLDYWKIGEVSDLAASKFDLALKILKAKMKQRDEARQQDAAS
jgi:hypothetical protein